MVESDPKPLPPEVVEEVWDYLLDALLLVWYGEGHAIPCRWVSSREDRAALLRLIELGLVRENPVDNRHPNILDQEPGEYELVQPVPAEILGMIEQAPRYTSAQVRNRLHIAVDALGRQMGLFETPEHQVSVELDHENVHSGLASIGDVVERRDIIRIVVRRQHILTAEDLEKSG